MHEWCGWLEKNKIAWLSQDDGDAPLSHSWRSGELRMSYICRYVCMGAQLPPICVARLYTVCDTGRLRTLPAQSGPRLTATALYRFTWGREKSKISCRHDILDFVFPLGSSNSSCRHEIGHDNWKPKVELQKTILFLHYSCNCARYLY